MLKFAALVIGIIGTLFLAADWYVSKNAIFTSEYINAAKLRRLLTETNPNEVPVFGSSKARSAFFPDSLSPRVYNYGMEKCGFDVMLFLLELELQKEKSGPVIVEFNHRSMVYAPKHTIDISTYIPNIKDPRVENFLRQNDRYEVYYKLPGFRYYGHYWDFIRVANRQKTGNTKTLNRGGIFIERNPSEDIFNNFVESRLDAIALRHALIERRDNPAKVISREDLMKLDYLNQYLDFSYDDGLKEKFENLVAENPEREFLVVYTPQHWSELKGIENFEEITALFSDWESRFPNLKTFDYSSFPLTDNEFKNSSHIDINGAKLFSAALRKDIASYIQ